MKFVCQVCGYVHEGDSAPEKCPVCNAPAEKFSAQAGEREWLIFALTSTASVQK